MKAWNIQRWMCCRFITDCQRQNFENRLTSGEVLDKSLVCCCLTDGANDIRAHGNGARRHYDVTVSYGENLLRFRSLQVVRKLSRKPPQAITEAVGVVLPLFIIFTARRYMLARYRAMLSSSVRHKPVLRRNDWSASWFWHGGFVPFSPHCLIRKFGYLQKLGYFLLGLWFVPNSGLGKFRRGRSIVLSTKLVVVDGRACWRHLCDDRRIVAVYYKSYCDL